MHRHDRQPQPPITPAGYAVGGAGILLVACGQYCWSAGRHLLGAVLVGVGGVLVGAVLVRAALIGLPRRRR